MEILKLGHRRDGLRTNAVSCYPFHRLLILRIIYPCSWKTGLLRPVFGICRLWSTACYPLFVSSSEHVMGCRFPVFRSTSTSFVSWCSCFITAAFVNSCARLWPRHLIHGCECNYASAFVAVQRLAEVDWTPRNTDDRLYYNSSSPGSIHDVPAGVIEMDRWDFNCNLIIWRTLPSREVSLIVPVECRVTFAEAAALIRLKARQSCRWCASSH